MASPSSAAIAQERELLEAAGRGDQDAYGRLLEPYRPQLHAHCYRMLGSVHDAEDAMQEALLRAWRGLARFEGRSSVRSWLYTIATNTCLNLIERRPKRVLPIDYGAATDPHDGLGLPPEATVVSSDSAVSLAEKPSTSRRISTARWLGGRCWSAAMKASSTASRCS